MSIKKKFNNNIIDTEVSIPESNNNNLMIHINDHYIDSNIKNHEIELAKNDRKDIFISSLLKYVYENETKNNNTRSFRQFLEIISKSGLIRQDILNPRYDNIRNVMLNTTIKTINLNSTINTNTKLIDCSENNHNVHYNEICKDDISKFDNILSFNTIKNQNDVYRNFKLIREINSGGYGTIYEVQSLIDNNIYALKKTKYNHMANNKWNNEVTIMSSLSHYNIINYHSSWIDYGIMNKTSIDAIYLYIQMELCDTDLSKLLSMYDIETRKEYIYDIYKQILLGVRYIHSKKIVHRDLKPANILIKLIGDDIKIKLSDFGCSKLIDTINTSSDEDTEIKIEHKIILPRLPSSEYIGTALYIAPEIENFRHYDYSSDIYSLGLILYEMMSNFITISEKIDKFKNIKLHLDIQNNPIHNIINKMISDNINERPNINEVIKLWSKKKIRYLFRY